MAKIGLVVSIAQSVYNIDRGRKHLAIDGKEGEGRLFFSDGLSSALTVFKEVGANAAMIWKP